MICDICKYKMNKIHINLPFFRHFDFLKTVNFKNLYKCEKCSLVVSSKVSSKEMNIMKSKKYMNKAQVKKKIFGSGFLTNREDFQKKIIASIFNYKRNKRILDIGCFDGSLLKEINKIEKGSPNKTAKGMNPEIPRTIFDKIMRAVKSQNFKCTSSRDLFKESTMLRF